MNYSQEMLYIFNSTYRNPLRPIEVTKKLTAIDTQNLSLEEQLDKVIGVVNKDVKLQDNTKEGQHKSFSRKKSELNKLPFITLKMNGEMTNHYDITKLNPVSQKFAHDIDTEGEYNSNVMLFVLSQKNHLQFMYSLINNIDKQWSSIGKRKGVSQLELVYLFGYLSQNKQSTVESLADIVVDIRKQFQQKKAQKNNTFKAGQEKDFLKEKILQDFSEKILNNGHDYTDTLMRAFDLTQCFNVTRHGIDQKNIFSMKMLSLDVNFIDKISFFLKFSYSELCSYLKDNSFCTLLYSNFNVIKAYHQQNKEINDLIKTNPFALPLQDKWENSTLPWCEYEYHCSVQYLQTLKKHDSAYDTYTKNVAVKTHLKSVYGGTTPGIADCYVIFDNLVVSVESSTLMQEYQQCNKEYIPNKTHIAKLVKDNHKSFGLCVTVMPKVTKEFNKEYMRHNYSNALDFDEEKTVLMALSTVQYTQFLKTVNTQKKAEDFVQYLLSINYKDYVNSDNVFFTIFQDFLNAQKQVVTGIKKDYVHTPKFRINDNHDAEMWLPNLYSHFIKKDLPISQNICYLI